MESNGNDVSKLAKTFGKKLNLRTTEDHEIFDKSVLLRQPYEFYFAQDDNGET